MATVNLTDEINGNTAASKEGGVVCTNDNLGTGLWGGLTIPHAPQLNFSTGNCSFSFWFKTGSDVTKTFIRGTKGVWGTGPAIRFGVFYDSASLSIQIYAWFTDTSNEAKAVASAILNASSWHHVVFAFDRTAVSMHQIYLNGSLLTNDVTDSYDVGVEASNFDNSEDLDIIAVQTQDDILYGSYFNLLSTNKSISLWAKVRGNPGVAAFSIQEIFKTNSSLTAVNYGYSAPAANVNITADENWHHYVFAYDNSASPKWNLYVDGASYGTGTYVDSYTYGGFKILTGTSFASGVNGILSGVTPMENTSTIDGGLADIWIDEVQYYYKKLDATDVAALYNEATATTERADCQARYSFDTGITWVDDSGNGNDEAATIFPAPGKFGNCLHLGLSRLELDEIQIYNRALSASEVLQLYGV